MWQYATFTARERLFNYTLPFSSKIILTTTFLAEISTMWSLQSTPQVPATTACRLRIWLLTWDLKTHERYCKEIRLSTASSGQTEYLMTSFTEDNAYKFRCSHLDQGRPTGIGFWPMEPKCWRKRTWKNSNWIGTDGFVKNKTIVVGSSGGVWSVPNWK